MRVPVPPGTYRISSGFGLRGGVPHRGIDYAAPLGTPILAAADGTVVEARSMVSGFGCWVWLQHLIGGQRVDSIYGHMFEADLMVKAGQAVTAGQQIARVGNNGESSGPHLHMEVWPGGRLGGVAVNPAEWLP